MSELIIVVASLAISALGSICVPICTREAHNDVVEHVIIIDEVHVQVKDIDNVK